MAVSHDHLLTTVPVWDGVKLQAMHREKAERLVEMGLAEIVTGKSAHELLTVSDFKAKNADYVTAQAALEKPPAPQKKAPAKRRGRPKKYATREMRAAKED